MTEMTSTSTSAGDPAPGSDQLEAGEQPVAADPVVAEVVEDGDGDEDGDEDVTDAEDDDEDDEDVTDAETDDEDDEDDAEEAETPAAGAGGTKTTDKATDKATDLFHESEVAADYVEGLLDILDLDGDIDELVVGGRPMVEVIEGGPAGGRRLQSLVGTRGATLEALQELTRLAVYRQTGTPSRLLLDVGGYRTARRKELSAIAKNAAEQVKEHGELIRMEPMSAFERKCIHDVINATAGVESESEGVEPSRRVVVRPTK